MNAWLSRWLPRMLLALTLGAAGGAVFWQLGLPLPWMLGAMVFNTVAAMAGAPVGVAPGMRRSMIAVLGVMLGSSFTPQILDDIQLWIGSLLALVVFVAVTTALIMNLLRRFGGFDLVTAYFSAAPGGLNEMMMMGRAMGGDDRTISLTHSIRILLVVLTVPFWFQYAYGYQPGSGSGAPGFAALAWSDAALLALAAVGGSILGNLARLPAADISGPLLLSAVLHMAALTRAEPPWELVVAAQVVIGSAIGARFVGVSVREVMGTLALGGVAALAMLVIAIVFAVGLTQATGLPFVLLLLALAPGGLAEMCLISLALGIDTAFVSTHHIMRIVLVVLFAPLAFRLMGRLARRKPAE